MFLSLLCDTKTLLVHHDKLGKDQWITLSLDSSGCSLFVVWQDSPGFDIWTMPFNWLGSLWWTVYLKQSFDTPITAKIPSKPCVRFCFNLISHSYWMYKYLNFLDEPFSHIRSNHNLKGLLNFLLVGTILTRF